MLDRRLSWKKCFVAVAVGGLVLLAVARADWRLALPGWTYEFPRDHQPHGDFKTEWWYFTGQLQTDEGRRFGYQLTFFRQGLRPPGARAEVQSRFVVDDLKFAHFAVTDVETGRFHFGQKVSRGAFGEAGFERSDPHTRSTRIAWIDDWLLVRPTEPRFQLTANHDGIAIDLAVADGKPWTIHGAGGISRKAAGEGHASHYYSGTRLPTTGTVTVEGRTFAVRGESWFDHEWASNQLAPGQAGWDWFSFQFADGTELMLYRMRLKDGGIDPQSSGTFIAADGSVQPLAREDYTLRPLTTWKSPATGASYPIAWELEIPSLALRLRVSTPVRGQELTLAPIAYWEGLIECTGTRAGQEVKGHGYMELTGYAGALVGLAE
jgi:predicted secreted hydrolase